MQSLKQSARRCKRVLGGCGQGFSFYQSLKCFLHGFVTDARELLEDAKELDPFNGTVLDPAMARTAEQACSACHAVEMAPPAAPDAMRRVWQAPNMRQHPARLHLRWTSFC